MKKSLCFLVVLMFAFTAFSQNILNDEDHTLTIDIDPQDEFDILIRNDMKITLSLDGGSEYDLFLEETKILSDQLSREMNNIKTYNAFYKGSFVGTYTWSPHGVWYYLTIDQKQIAVYPDIQHKNNTHFVEYGAKKMEGVVCGLDNTFDESERETQSYTPDQMRDITASFGQDLRDYRIYIVTTGEFYQLNGAAPGLVDAVIASTINGLNAIYQNELSLKFTLVDRRLHNNAATDPFTPDELGGEPRTTQAGSVINGLYGAARYDIGHVLHKSVANDGWGSGGVARLNSVCNDAVNNGVIAKASGWSGSFNNSGFGWLGLIGHELGHQFGAEHTFNGMGSSCQDAISTTTAYEIGSGTTIMSYNGICEAGQNISASGGADNYFHVNSLMQMMDHIVGNGDCAAKVASNNNFPVVTMNPCGASIIVPKNTPFYINADAIDADGDPMTYCWEQFDEDGAGTPTQGAIGISAAVSPNAPLFRSYPPKNESFRYFPDRNTVLNGNSSDPFDVLPALGRTINLKLTVRDNNTNGGGTTIEDLSVLVSNQGPLVVSPQNDWDTGDNVAINWTIGNSSDLCTNADVYLSIDGGQTYPYLIGDDVNYGSGTMNFTVTGLYPSTTRARIKVECDDYDCFTFYDVTNLNREFDINSICDAPTAFLCPAVDQMFDSGDPGLNMTNQNNIIGEKATVISRDVSFGSSNMDVVIFDTNGTSCKELDNYVAEFVTIQVDKPGDYIFEIDPNFEGYGFVSIFTDSNFSPTNACPSFVSSSGVWSGTGTSVSARRSMTATLDPCVLYRLAFFNYQPTAMTRIDNITGPGDAIIEETTPNPDYSFVYIAVDNVSNLITFINQDPNFSSLPGGSYTIYGITYKSGGTTPPNITDINAYLNQTFNSFYVDGDCFLSTSNSFQLDIEGSCSLTGATIGTTGSCSAADNMFSQEVTLTYDVSPTSGDLVVNGQSFAIAASPQTVLISLPSNGELFIGEAFFSAEPNCKVTFEVQQPDNCCAFDVDLGDTIDICSGEIFTLNAGIGGVGGSYQWFDGAGTDLMITASTLDVTVAGQYSVLVTSSTGCPKRDTVTIQVNDVPTLTVSDDITICDGEFITLSATTNGTTVRWLSADTLIQEGVTKTLTINTGGVYTVESFFAEECKITAMITVTANVSPDPQLGGDVFLCEGESVTLDGTADGNEYVWFLDNVVQAEVGPMFDINVTSTIRVEVTNAGGCTGTDEIDVLVEGVPTLSVSDDVTICDGEMTTLTATTSASLIKWFVDGELFQSGPDNTYDIMSGGLVLIQAGNSENCALEDSITVTANVSPNPRLGFNVEKCEGETTRIASDTEGETYIWYLNGDVIPMETDSFIFVDQTATYTLEVTNAGGCTGTDEVDVEFFAPAIANAGGDVEYCEGEVASIVANASSVIFFWTKDGIAYPEDDLAFTTDQPGEYVLEVQNEADCSTYDTIQVTQNAAPILDFGDDRNACIGDMVELEGPDGVGYIYQWFRNTVPFSTDPSITVSDNGTYVLYVTDDKGCSNEDGVEVTFSPGPTLTINETDIMLCENDIFTAEVVTNASGVQWYKDGDVIAGATNLTLDISESGTYTAQAEGMSGCLVTETVEVQVNPVPVVMLDDELVACDGDMVTLESNAMGDSYSWVLNNVEVSTDASFDTDQEGIYTLIITNEFDCTAEDMIEVSFVPLPSIDLVTMASFCEGATILLEATTDGNAYQWLLDGSEINGATSTSYDANEAGTYTFISTGQGSCANMQIVEVSSVAAPTVDLGEEVTLCPGESITLDAGPNSGSVFEWSSGDNTRTIDLMNDNVTSQSSETITVNVTNSSDCSTSDMIIVNYLPILVVSVTSENDGVCTGDSLLLVANGGEQYDWSGPPGTFISVNDNSILVFPDTPADYTVNASDQCPNNMDSETLSINVYTPQDVSAGNDTCILIGRTVDLNAFGGVRYQWAPDPTLLSGGSTATPSIMPEVETTYSVTITDSNGCTKVDDITVCIITDPLSIFKPVNAITPNGDGFNDELEFPGLEAFAENTLIIYNRWGNVIYEKEGYQQDGFLFGGLRNGEDLPADTYYYILKFDEFVIKETLTIIRPN